VRLFRGSIGELLSGLFINFYTDFSRSPSRLQLTIAKMVMVKILRTARHQLLSLTISLVAWCFRTNRMAQDILASFHAVRDQLKERLKQQPEYRAMIAAEKAISEISNILYAAEMAAAPNPMSGSVTAVEEMIAAAIRAPSVAPKPTATPPRITPYLPHNRVA
jgi:hypothetical protein